MNPMDALNPHPKPVAPVTGAAFRRAIRKYQDKLAGRRRSYTPPAWVPGFWEAWRRWVGFELARPLRRELLYESVTRRFTRVEELPA